MIIGDVLYQTSLSKIGNSPIIPVNVFLSKSDIALKISSTHKGYSGAFLTFKQLVSIGEIIILELNSKLNQTELIQVPSSGQPYNLLIGFPAWLPDANITIWEILEMPIIQGSTSNSVTATIKRLETATSTEGKVPVTDAGILIIAANPNRTVLYVTNTGTEWVCVNHKTPVVYGQGIMLAPSGGSYMIESGNLDKRLLHGICATGKTSEIAFYEGTGEEAVQT